MSIFTQNHVSQSASFHLFMLTRCFIEKHFMGELSTTVFCLSDESVFVSKKIIRMTNYQNGEISITHPFRENMVPLLYECIHNFK